MTTVRRAGAVSGATLSGLALALGFVHLAAPGWAKQVGLDVWNISAAREEAREIHTRCESLAIERGKLHREMELADHLATRLMEGKVSLRDAVDQLAPHLERRTGFETVWRWTYQVPSFRHGVARYAINRVARELCHDPSRWSALAPQLETEYAALK